MRTNAQTVYAAACCLTVHQIFSTYEEAEALSNNLEQRVTPDHIEGGYVLTFEPGEIKTLEWDDRVIEVVNEFNRFECPEWLQMKNVPGTVKLPSPSRLVGYAHREW